MKIIKPKYYKDFACIAGACPDSCCQGWEVDADEESLAFYQTLSPELDIKQRIDSVLDKDEFGNTIFRLAPKKRCPFLNDSNLCDMHIAIGGEHTPTTCRNFPRFIYDFGATREIGLSFSCPVAAELIYHFNGHLSFDVEENDALPALNDIDAMTFITLKKARYKVYSVLQQDGVNIRQKIIDILRIAQELQVELNPYQEGVDSIPFFDVLKNPELINPEWDEKLQEAAIRPIKDSLMNEHIAFYFIYKYFMQAVYDRDVLSKVKLAALGVLIHSFVGEGAWTMHLWSKETEHSQYNMDRLTRLLREADCLSVASLIKFFQ